MDIATIHSGGYSAYVDKKKNPFSELWIWSKPCLIWYAPDR